MKWLRKPEHWKDIPGYSKLYQVSSLGRVKRMPRVATRKGTQKYSVSERVLTPSINKKGYLRVCLRKNRRVRSHLVHRLVLLAFVGRCPEGKETCHGDGNPANNKRSNLRYGTKESNEADKKRHGTDNAGSRQWQSILTEEDVLEIRTRFFDAGGLDQKDLAEEYGVHQTTIHDVLHKKKWCHVGGPDCFGILKLRRYKYKITRSMEDKIVALRKRGWPQQDIANEFGVNASTISRVLKHRGMKRIRCNQVP